MSQATAETITVGALGVRFLVEGADSGGSVSVFECYVPANSKMPAPHSHDAFEETIYGLKGATTWTVDGKTIEIGVGEALCVPRGAIHGFAERRQHRCDVPRDRQPRRLRTRLLPRGRRGPGRLRRRPPGPICLDGGDASPRSHAGPAERGLTLHSANAHWRRRDTPWHSKSSPQARRHHGRRLPQAGAGTPSRRRSTSRCAQSASPPTRAATRSPRSAPAIGGSCARLPARARSS